MRLHISIVGINLPQTQKTKTSFKLMWVPTTNNKLHETNVPQQIFDMDHYDILQYCKNDNVMYISAHPSLQLTQNSNDNELI